ncbi:MAG: diguanylate cyclase [Mogibacterium sp.]|nr:diguanylate cyclase [Mogibacterium sp.]
MKGSLRNKSVIIIIISAVILCGAMIISSYRIVSNLIDSDYKAKARDLSETLAVSIDAEAAGRVRKAVEDIYNSTENRVGSEEWGSDAWNEYQALFSEVEESDDFKALKEELTKIQDVNEVDCVYLTYVDVPTKSFIYLVDAAHEEPCPPGCFDPIYDINKQVLTRPEVGFPPYVTNTDEYGWLVTAAAPVYDKDGNVIAYTATDISMNDIKAYERRALATLILLEVALAFVIAFLVIRAISRSIIKPINELTDAAAGFYREESTHHSSFSSLDIKTGDEIESLSESMKQMERDINDNIANILALTDELDESRGEAILLNELAKKDALTGVRNKLAYDEETRKLEKELADGETKIGLALFDLDDLKKINDTYGHEKGDVAIRLLAANICRVYAHSPVFRVGGDEFVAVLKGGDYERAEELREEFQNALADLRNDPALDPWERISASEGLARFDAVRDRGVDDLFRHADNDMYVRKRAAKGYQQGL